MRNPLRRPAGASGFTLIELSYVVAILAVVAAMSVPAYDHFLRRAHTAEAYATLGAIAHAELRRLRDTGEYLACPAVGELPGRVAAFPNDEPCWRALGIRVEGPVRFRYSVELTDGSFTAVAEADLDRDGTPSVLRLRGVDLSIDVDREGE